MRRRQQDPEYDAAVSRRLATLSAELAAVRGDLDAPTRVRPQEYVAAPVVPVPGRHAHRRVAMPRLLSRFGITGLGPWHVAVVAVVAAGALTVAAWWVLASAPEPLPRDDAIAAAQPLVPMGEARDVPVDPAPVTGGAPAQDAGEVTVDVAGKVRSPGIAVLPAGSRVVDALDAAGGARRGVDLTSLNLARVLVDGEQILVGMALPTGASAALGDPGTTPQAGSLVSINTADQPTLETLPGVGPVTAGAIISWRTQNGGFTAVEELVEVDGIGEATLAKLIPFVTL